MEISERLRERFCKDCGIPIKIFKEPYFSDRLKLLDDYFDTLEKYRQFVIEIEKYDTEQEYFEHYNKVKDDAINYIKSSEGYQAFNEEDMNNYAIKNQGYPNKDIFHSNNDKRVFISVDMKKANFNCLRYYNRNIFGARETWEEFISMFSPNKHIINSKYIRQVILGNCNPKRCITYEKYLMDQVLTNILCIFDSSDIVFFSNDEIIIDVTNLYGTRGFASKYAKIPTRHGVGPCSIPLKKELFTLNKITGCKGYVKHFLKESNFEFKCIDSLMFPFVIRALKGEEVTESDCMFMNEGLLSKFIEIPQINIEW